MSTSPALIGHGLRKPSVGKGRISGTLITHWNEASQSLPVLALKSDYQEVQPETCLNEVQYRIQSLREVHSRN